MNESSREASAPEHRRRTRIGIVTSRSGNKSVKITIPYKIPHPRYGKVINRKTVVHAHDEENATVPGDRVEVVESRPLSKLKRWRVVRIVAKTSDVVLGKGEELQ